MKSDHKILILQNDRMYISEVKSENDKTIELVNPMMIEHKYNTENMPVFRYIPWQILSTEPIVKIDKKNVIMMTKPKVELLDVYQRICISFIPIDRSEDD